ncbi:hypothetical protein [Bdellovibrio bacteriovorus]|uniref:hypothetical protein n=1 Tax=Bdellovibrio bacteriovorus TaxID=959 RepID=UPI0035A5EE51
MNLIKGLYDKRFASLCLQGLVLAPWVGICLLYMILPISYQSSLTGQTYLILFLHILLCAVGCWIGFSTGDLIPFESERKKSGSLGSSQKNFAIVFLSLSLLACISLFYDRIFIQGVDFTQGLASARGQWAQAGSTRVGVSSLWSVFGNIFILAYFPAAVWVGYYSERFSLRMLLVTGFLSYVVSLGHSTLNGGRSPVMFFILMFFSVIVIRLFAGRSWTFGFKPIKFVSGIILMILFTLSYANVVFISRSSASGMATSEYAQNFTPHLGASLSPSFQELIGDGPIGSQVSAAVLGGAYLTHGLWRINALLGQSDNCISTIRSVVVLFERAGFSEPKDCLLDGFMAPVPAVFGLILVTQGSCVYHYYWV